ncbi:MAG TPA: hypothetical protein PKU95_01200 [Candidatus Dojkabacteria bacterium]|nr:hypothetical protein [Candidatus Dojkabacteria bacterium]HOY46231.1 hypothetical protein [Candidatus Dojkabacteria bacterium]
MADTLKEILEQGGWVGLGVGVLVAVLQVQSDSEEQLGFLQYPKFPPKLIQDVPPVHVSLAAHNSLQLLYEGRCIQEFPQVFDPGSA